MKNLTSIVISERARKLADGLGLRELILQCCCPAGSGFTDAQFAHLGGCFLHPGKLEDVRKLVARLRAACPIPPVITSDMEAGPGDMVQGATRFPSLMAAGAALRKSGVIRKEHDAGIMQAVLRIAR